MAIELKQIPDKTSEALVRYYNILTGKEPDTPQEFLPEESAVKQRRGRTLEHERPDYKKNLVEKVTLFKKATKDDLDKRTGDWSSLEVSGPITSLRYTTKGADLPDITTRISAEGKTLERVNDEIISIYTLLKNIKDYLNLIDEFEEGPDAKNVLFDFFKDQYKIDPKTTYDYVKRLKDFDTMIIENDLELQRPNVKSIWKKDSTANKKRYAIEDFTDGHTDYIKFTIHTPNDIQYKTEQTTCMVRVGKLTPIDRLKTIVDGHLQKLTPVYKAAIL